MKTNKYEKWLITGIENGWISEPYCNTHDGGFEYMTQEEIDEWEAGGDPCCVVVRLIEEQWKK